MIPGNLPRRGRMPTAQQQRVMMQTVQALNNPVLTANGANTVSVNQDGISARNYTPQRIAARITGHGTGNLYSFEQVLITASSGTVSTLTGGSTGSTTVFAAIELNGRTDVPTGAIVDMIADAGPYGFAFVYDSGNGIEHYIYSQNNAYTATAYIGDIVEMPANALDAIVDVLVRYTWYDNSIYDVQNDILTVAGTVPMSGFISSFRLAFAVQRRVTGVAYNIATDPVIATSDDVDCIDTIHTALPTYDPVGAPDDYIAPPGAGQVLVDCFRQRNLQFGFGEQATSYTYYLTYQVTPPGPNTAGTTYDTIFNGDVYTYILTYGAQKEMVDTVLANATNL